MKATVYSVEALLHSTRTFGTGRQQYVMGPVVVKAFNAHGTTVQYEIGSTELAPTVGDEVEVPSG